MAASERLLAGDERADSRDDYAFGLFERSGWRSGGDHMMKPVQLETSEAPQGRIRVEATFPPTPSSAFSVGRSPSSERVKCALAM